MLLPRQAILPWELDIDLSTRGREEICLLHVLKHNPRRCSRPLTRCTTAHQEPDVLNRWSGCEQLGLFEEVELLSNQTTSDLGLGRIAFVDVNPSGTDWPLARSIQTLGYRNLDVHSHLVNALNLLFPGRRRELPVELLSRQVVPVLSPIILLMLDRTDLIKGLNLTGTCVALHRHQVLCVQLGLIDDSSDNRPAQGRGVDLRRACSTFHKVNMSRAPSTLLRQLLSYFGAVRHEDGRLEDWAFAFLVLRRHAKCAHVGVGFHHHR